MHRGCQSPRRYPVSHVACGCLTQAGAGKFYTPMSKLPDRDARKGTASGIPGVSWHFGCSQTKERRHTFQEGQIMFQHLHWRPALLALALAALTAGPAAARAIEEDRETLNDSIVVLESL